VVVTSPRPCQASDVPLFIGESDDNVEERGIRWDDRADTWNGHDMNWALY